MRGRDFVVAVRLHSKMIQVAFLHALVIVAGSLWLFDVVGCAALDTPVLRLWPLPRSLEEGGGRVAVAPDFTFSCESCPPLLEAAAERTRRFLVSQAVAGGEPALRSCTLAVVPQRASSGDESYELYVSADGGECSLVGGGLRGALHGLTTLRQSVEDGVLLAAPLRISDAPRFAYRGLLLDTARRFIPVPKILSTLDAMQATKLNVFHWHICDAESFPLLLPEWPSLAATAWHPAAVYSPADVWLVIRHAAERGISVIPEIDLPAHGVWGRAFPELAACGDTIDPTQDASFDLLARLLNDVLDLFSSSDTIFLGGDEVDVSCFASNPRIAAWLDLHSASVDSLVPLFWRRMWAEVFPRLTQGRPGTPQRLMRVGVWLGSDMAVPLDELPSAAYINAWQPGALAAAVDAGVPVVASSGLYLDTVALPPNCTRKEEDDEKDDVPPRPPCASRQACICRDMQIFFPRVHISADALLTQTRCSRRGPAFGAPTRLRSCPRAFSTLRRTPTKITRC